jgi:hypothetical protein
VKRVLDHDVFDLFSQRADLPLVALVRDRACELAPKLSELLGLLVEGLLALEVGGGLVLVGKQGTFSRRLSWYLVDFVDDPGLETDESQPMVLLTWRLLDLQRFCYW